MIEAAWATAHLVMYPLGLRAAPAPATRRSRRHNFSGLSPVQRGLFHHGVDAAETPILLVHGIIENHAIFTVMERALRRRGFQALSAYDYGVLTQHIPRAAVRLGESIEKLSAVTGYERIHVIGHSLGGLIASGHSARLRCSTAARPTAHPEFLSDPGASGAGTGLPHPVHRVPQGHRPSDCAEPQRPPRPS